ncbi:hypothetical protein [Nostoc sp.]|nr:hypothetical protein [Nostoc sp. ChiQUE02]MDZ8229069.1 hypothetical protein [Nostoc sp. ChiQUE02]
MPNEKEVVVEKIETLDWLNQQTSVIGYNPDIKTSDSAFNT